MDPNLFVTMGRELRQLKEMHRDDWELQHHADLMIAQMRSYGQTQNPGVQAFIERHFMANLKWLVEWKRRKLAVANPVL